MATGESILVSLLFFCGYIVILLTILCETTGQTGKKCDWIYVYVCECVCLIRPMNANSINCLLAVYTYVNSFCYLFDAHTVHIAIFINWQTDWQTTLDTLPWTSLPRQWSAALTNLKHRMHRVRDGGHRCVPILTGNYVRILDWITFSAISMRHRHTVAGNCKLFCNRFDNAIANEHMSSVSSLFSIIGDGIVWKSAKEGELKIKIRNCP